MPLDVSGPHARYTDEVSEHVLRREVRGNLVKLRRAGDRSLQFLILNEEFLVSASQQLALITSLPFVHTARRYYRLNGFSEIFGLDTSRLATARWNSRS